MPRQALRIMQSRGKTRQMRSRLRSVQRLANPATDAVVPSPISPGRIACATGVIPALPGLGESAATGGHVYGPYFPEQVSIIRQAHQELLGVTAAARNP